jgi:hypothetical protein
MPPGKKYLRRSNNANAPKKLACVFLHRLQARKPALRIGNRLLSLTEASKWFA